MHRMELAPLIYAAVVAFAACAAPEPTDSAGPAGSPPASIAPLDAAAPREAAAPYFDDAAPAPSRADDGETLVRERGCPRCHQSASADDGVLSGQTAPRPGTHAYGSNLTPDEDTGLGGWSDDMIARAIRDGYDDQGSQLCPTMPRFADLSDDQVGAIVAYLRGLPPVKREIPESACGPAADADAGAPDAARADAGGADAAERDAGGADASPCATWAAPDVRAACRACSHRPDAGIVCQPNGCFTGWWCDTTAHACRPPPKCAFE